MADSRPSLLSALSDSIHGDLDPDTRRRMRALFTDPLFTPAPSLDREDRHRRMYEQLGAVNRHFGPGTELLTDPSRLFALFGWAGLASPSLSFAMLVHYCLALATIVDQGSPSARHAQALDELSTIGCFLITEVGRGSSHVATRTEAHYVPERDEFVLHTPAPAAAKLTNIALPGVPKLGVVCARLKVAGRDRGVFAFAVQLRDHEGLRPGIRTADLPGIPLMPTDSSILSFDQVSVPREAWLPADATIDEQGTFHSELATPDARLVRTMASGSFCWPAQAASLAAAGRACVTIAVRHAFRRITMGRDHPRRPAIAHRNQQRALLGALAEAYAVTHLARRSAARRSTEPANPGEITRSATPWSSVNRESVLVKALAARSLERIAARCQNSMGALSLMNGTRIAEYRTLGHAYHFAGGDGQLILLDTARALLASAPSPEPPDLGELGPDQNHALDARFLNALAAAREHLAHQQLTDHPDDYDAALELAEAHAARLTLETSLRAADLARSADGSTRAAELLEALAAFHALQTLHEDAGRLLAVKLLTPAQATEIPRALNVLGERLLPHAPTLVDAFAIPDALLRSPASAIGEF